jgi:hypothetical protein
MREMVIFPMIAYMLSEAPCNGHPTLKFSKERSMGKIRMPGLTKRGAIWHLDKQFKGVRIRESAATSSLNEALALLANRIERVRLTHYYGVRPARTFREAARKYLQENQRKRSIDDDARHLRILNPFIGHLTLPAVHMDSLRPFV